MNKIKDIKYNEYNTLDIYLPQSEEFDLLIYIHGGGLEVGDKEEIYPASTYLVDKGIAIISLNYRLYPNCNYPDFIYDVLEGIKYSIDHINEYGKCKNIYIGGTSAGAYITQLICFNTSLLAKYSIDKDLIKGYIHDAGQPTTHFNVLKYQGIDPRRIIIDDKAPLYYIGLEKEYPRMLFLVSTNDLENRYEQTMLVKSTLKHFNYDISKVEVKVMNGTHCSYVGQYDENNESVFGKIIYNFIKEKAE